MGVRTNMLVFVRPYEKEKRMALKSRTKTLEGILHKTFKRSKLCNAL